MSIRTTVHESFARPRELYQARDSSVLSPQETSGERTVEKPFVAAFRSFGFGWAALGPFVVELNGSGLDASADDSFLFPFPCPSGSIPAR